MEEITEIHESTKNFMAEQQNRTLLACVLSSFGSLALAGIIVLGLRCLKNQNKTNKQIQLMMQNLEKATKDQG